MNFRFFNVRLDDLSRFWKYVRVIFNISEKYHAYFVDSIKNAVLGCPAFWVVRQNWSGGAHRMLG